MRRRLLSVIVGFAVMGTVLSSARPARAQTVSLNDVIGAISNAYGSFQAAQFLLTFFGVGASNQMSAAVTEIKNFGSPDVRVGA